jgi:hypothetical protein
MDELSGATTRAPDADGRTSDGHAGLFPVLSALLNLAVTGIAALGVAGLWGHEHRLAITILAAPQMAGTIIQSQTFPPSAGIGAVRIIRAYNWAVLGVIMFLAGGYPSPY